MRVIAIQSGRLGDLVFSLPGLTLLKSRHPGVSITMAARPEFSAILACAPCIDNLIDLNQLLSGKLDLETGEWDLALNLSADRDCALIMQHLRAVEKRGRLAAGGEEIRLLDEWSRLFFATLHDRRGNSVNMADLLAGVSAGRPGRVDKWLLPVRESSERIEELIAPWRRRHHRLVALQLGSSHPDRAWPVEDFAALALDLLKDDRNGIVITGSPQERPLAEEFRKHCNVTVLDLVGKTSLADLPALFSRVDRLISNDTGPMHIAAAVGTPVLGIFFGHAWYGETAPYGPGHAVIQADLPCSPCREGASCRRLSCRRLLNQGLVSDLAGQWLAGRIKPETIIPAGVCLYISDFTPAGTLFYRNGQASGDCAPDLTAQLLRTVLSSRWPELGLDRKYFGMSGKAFSTAAATMLVDLSWLRQKMQRGAEICLELKRNAALFPPPTDLLRGLAGELNELENQVMDRNDNLAVLRHFYHYEIMDCGFLPLAELSDELASRYEKMSGWISGALDLLKEPAGNESGQRIQPDSVELISSWKRTAENYRLAQDELMLLEHTPDQEKDILIVVRDQLPLLRNCLDSLAAAGGDFNLFIWDNDSGAETREYLRARAKQEPRMKLVESNENLGFIRPNNELAALGHAPWLILLNSDTEVLPGWDRALLGVLQAVPETAAAGYLGGILNENGLPAALGLGNAVDYLGGFCLALSRQTYDEHGLFDQAYQFAYFEDSDFCLRLQEKGKQIYALHLDLVHHLENRTVKAEAALPGRAEFLAAAFRRNQELFLSRWSSLIRSRRRAGR